jgi:hypothetical protein
MTTATINWTLPTQRTDGTPLAPTDLASTEIFDSVNGAAATLIATVPTPATMLTTPSLVPGTHVFTLSAVDTAGTVGVASTPVSETVPTPALAPPAAITGVTVVLNP